MFPLVPLVGLLGCAGGALEPSAQLDDDPILAALPAEAALVGRVALPAAALRPWEEAGLLDLGRLPLTAPPDGLALACDPVGCLALVEGEVEPTLAPSRGPHRWDLALPGLDLRWRRLAWDKAVAGEAPAVQRLVAARARGEEGLDLAPLEGAVPDGQAWVVARDPHALATLARARGLDLPELPAEVDQVRTVALSLRAEGARAHLTARVVLADEAAARRLATALRQVRPAGVAAEVAAEAVIVREGVVVEVQGLALDPEQALRALDEVAP